MVAPDMLCGPSLLAMGKLCVLQRSDAADMYAVTQAVRTTSNAADQAQPPLLPWGLVHGRVTS
jgi:hypothetical protein